ncbi:hypothetical protein DUI87_06945 [Hirundo rustica rustica]|uniref:Uncharacterized protein n=1 Tax=Hirundo rustica rustica TaxID=333673 RepID=A0A3M0KVG8_HIRRU|nr:hypothetical protein DUI87_06945 [Hirundo rustica rustica]
MASAITLKERKTTMQTLHILICWHDSALSLVTRSPAPFQTTRWKCGTKKISMTELCQQRDNEPESVLSLPVQEEEAEPPASSLDSNPCKERHSEPLPTALLEDLKTFVDCALTADPGDEANEAGMQAGRAQASLLQEKPCKAEPPAEACPETAQPLARSVPTCSASSAAGPQPQPHGNGAPSSRGPAGFCVGLPPSTASGGKERSEPDYRHQDEDGPLGPSWTQASWTVL